MSNTNVFISTILVLTVFSRLANSVPMQIMSENLEIQNKHEITTVGIAELNDRSSNLKYVLAIQSSSIWSAIKQKTLMIKTLPQLGEISEKSLDDLTDQELLKLKKACHDGLKCVAIDQLMVLQTVMEPMANGKMSVRTAITKITKVISEYTYEYHQDSYVYEEVQESDDRFKIHEAVTTIVNDNRELCQLDIDTADDAGKSAKDNNTSSGDTTPVKNLTVNFGTINNYNINDGTINNVSVTPSGETNKKESASHQSSNKDGTPEPSYLIIVDPQSAGPKLENRNSGSQDDVHHGSENVDNGKRAVPTNAPNDTSATDVPETGTDDTNILKNNNYVSLSNKGDCGCTTTGCGCGCSTDVGVASAGSFNEGNVRNGNVRNGIINNGDLKQNKVNNGSINKGTIDQADANGGIISVGTVNNGPTNYGTYSNSTNNGTEAEFNNHDIQQYVASIDNMYSTILDHLTKT